MGEKTGEQVEVYFYKTEPELKFLLMKRVSARGGFWQPLTGGVEIGETYEDTVRREAKEETGIDLILEIIPTNYSFEFNEEGR